ncbi:hypothetical protein MDS_1128 [Ectopseudomonas mendocina NK-01]|nr:hypothetical protein MDS_1128 [Pseudomonas mendocina NK-01]
MGGSRKGSHNESVLLRISGMSLLSLGTGCWWVRESVAGAKERAPKVCGMAMDSTN